MRRTTRVLTRDETFGMTRYDNIDFTPAFLGRGETPLIPDDAVHIHRRLDVEGVRSDILIAPVRVYIDLTRQCSLRCMTCLNESGRPLRDELSADEFIHVVEGIARDGVMDVRFTGGEPTMKSGWQDVFSAAREAGMIVTMNTNGILSRKTIDDVIDLHPDEVSVSLDGGRMTNDMIRGRGAYDRAVKTIAELSSAGIRTTINSVVGRYTTDEDIDALIGIASEYCDDIDFFPLRPFGRARTMRDKMLTFTELDALMRKIEGRRTGTKLRTRSESLQRNAIRSGTYNLAVGGSDMTRFNIMPNGNLYANGCAPYVNGQMWNVLKLGNIVREGYSLRHVWLGSKELDQWREWSGMLQKRCEGCAEFKERCGGFLIDMEVYKAMWKRNEYCKMR